MIISIHLIAVAVVLGSWLPLMTVLLRTAPLGYQNEDGFHVGEGVELE